jgi:thymidylate synthase ThyX
MKIDAVVLKDSMCCTRITTMMVTMPKFLVAQLNTHRAFSRNSASSRAIPMGKVREQVRREPYIPTDWPSAQKGMLGGPSLRGEDAESAAWEWMTVREEALAAHVQMERIGVAKEIANRLLEPFMWTQIIITATDWAGFFEQRLPGNGAQGEMAQVALAMHQALHASMPGLLHPGEWHLPLAEEGLGVKNALAQSAARCARVSYKRQGVETTIEQDRERHDMLIKEGHWSPLEHQAQAMLYPDRVRNFHGWRQYRDLVEENND